MIRSQATTADQLALCELAALDALEDRGWCTRVELAERIGVLPAAAASLLRELAGRGLVRRGSSWERVGQWQITRLGSVTLDRVGGSAP